MDRYRCIICKKTFSSYLAKSRHMSELHYNSPKPKSCDNSNGNSSNDDADSNNEDDGNSRVRARKNLLPVIVREFSIARANGSAVIQGEKVRIMPENDDEKVCGMSTENDFEY